MQPRFVLTALVAFLAALAAGQAAALDIQPYQPDVFARVRAADKPVALQFHSGWCPICIMQERGVRALKDDKVLDDLIVFQADFFKEEALRKQHNVTSFSTLVIFRGEHERARTTGEHRPEQLRLLFDKAR